jgi:hypothetical protein
VITHVFLDLDGVLVDFLGGAMKAHGETIDKIIPGEWWVHKYLGITEEEFWSKITGHQFWAGLLPLWDFHLILQIVYVFTAGQDMTWLCSSPARDPGCYSGKAA